MEASGKEITVRMEQQVEETFTLRVLATKTGLFLPPIFMDIEDVNPFMDEPPILHPDILTISFNEGMLKNVKNEFRLNVLSDLQDIRVYYTSNLDNVQKVWLSRMNLTVLAKGTPECSVLMIPKIERYEYGETLYYYCLDSSMDDLKRLWTDDADELKVDITVSLRSEPKTVEYSTAARLPEVKLKPRIFELFLSTKFSDVSIRCQDEIIPAHILILRHSSPVFAKMFEHEMKESKEKFVEIVDADVVVVREMLRYIYTGEVENLKDMEMQKALYTLADKYMLDDLKALCTRFLIQLVNRENALEMCLFGIDMQIPLLIEKAGKLVVENKKELFKNHEDFQAFMASVPRSMRDELFQLFMRLT